MVCLLYYRNFETMKLTDGNAVPLFGDQHNGLQLELTTAALSFFDIFLLL